MPHPLYSLLHPTARPEAWRHAYDTWLGRAAVRESVEYVLCVDQRWGFDRANACVWMPRPGPRDVLVWNHGRKCWVDSANQAARHSTGAVLIVVSDDIEPPQDWDLLLQRAGHALSQNHDGSHNLTLRPFGRGQFVIHVSTGYCDGPRACGMQILSRGRYERLGYVLYPGYESLYSDDDFLEHAYRDGIVIDARELMFPHHHADMNDWDEVYLHQNRSEARALGAELFERRKRMNFAEELTEVQR